MTRLGSSALLLAMVVAGGCAATSSDDVGSNEDAVHLGRPWDAGSDATTTTTADAGASTDASAPADEDAASDAAPPPRGPSTTTMAAKLTAIGLDVNNLPSLHDMPTSQKLKVMRTFNESMGVTCNNCHDVSNYAAPTKQKAIAMDGWELISRKLTMADGGAVYCDSCHYGKFDFLDRSSHHGIEQWMQTNFVEQLKTKTGDPMVCTTCHVNGAPTEPGSTH